MRGEFYIICYDSPSDKRRRKLHKLLKNFAIAVQKSVFETFLEASEFDRMMRKIRELMDEKSDSVRIYGLSRTAQKRMKVIGFPGRLIDPDHYFVSDAAKEGIANQKKYVEIDEDGDLPDWL
jgi:CRISPR-associated protein Cas2